MAANRSETLTGTVDLPFPEYADPPTEPLGLLRRWLEEAQQAGVREPRALALATADNRGRTSIRTVVLTEVTGRGLLFTTHGPSRKGRELRENPWASGLLYWRETSRQVSVSGPVEQVSDARSDALWEARPVFAHAMSAASRQSEPLAEPAGLRDRAARLAEAGALPRPASYVGMELVARSVEFWANGTDRLHERLRYDRTDEGRAEEGRTGEGWAPVRLQP